MRIKGPQGHYVSTPDAERFWEKVDQSGDCWLWQGATLHDYGRFWSNTERRMVPAHRFAYENRIARIPEGLHIDHLCRNPRCVNPDHMEPVTPKTNTMRGEGPSAKAATRTHCPQGHAYDEANTWRDKYNRRHCRTCHRTRSKIQSRKYRAEQREQRARRAA